MHLSEETKQRKCCHRRWRGEYQTCVISREKYEVGVELFHLIRKRSEEKKPMMLFVK